jgi:glycosyltransferase involved in cell wall biosynthesis
VIPASEAPHPLPKDVMLIPAVHDEDLPALYSAADCFVTASHYEGYCLPVAEALSCGCPVIACNRTAIPEIAAGNAMLLEPTLEAWKRAMEYPPKRPVEYRRPEWKDAAEKTAKVLMEYL